jgi:hypothetical protein
MIKHEPPAISSGGARVIASGTVIPFDEKGEVALEIGPHHERLAIVLRFEDAGGSEPQIDVKRAGAQLVRLVFRNVGSPTGDGTTAPLRLGVLEGLSLFGQFRVFRVGTGPRTLHYTIFESGDISMAETLVR